MRSASTRLKSPAYFPIPVSKSRLVKLNVPTCAPVATIFVATQVARPHAVTKLQKTMTCFS